MFYKKRIVTRDTPEMVSERIAHRKAHEQALADRKLAYPVLTADNFDAAANYQTARIEELLRTIK